MIDHLKRLDWILMGAVALVFVMGLLTLYGDAESREFFYRQAVFGLAAFFIILGTSFFDWRIIKENSFFVLILYLAGVLALFVLFAAGSRVRGVASWFDLGSFNLEPVEPVKIILIMMLAKYFSARNIELYRWKNIFISAVYAAVPIVLVMIQPDLGSAIVLAAIWLGLTLTTGIRIRQFLGIIVLAAVSSVFLWSYALEDYQKSRITNFLYPESDPLGGSYQGTQALIALGSGGFWGKGLGGGTQTRLGFLPEYQTDFIFAAVAEEWGLVGLAVFLAGWFLIFQRLYKIILDAADNFSRLFVSGFALVLAAHFFINIGANLGFLPITGLSLIFVSHGGSNLISAALGLGLTQSVRSKIMRRTFGSEEVLWE